MEHFNYLTTHSFIESLHEMLKLYLTLLIERIIYHQIHKLPLILLIHIYALPARYQFHSILFSKYVLLHSKCLIKTLFQIAVFTIQYILQAIRKLWIVFL